MTSRLARALTVGAISLSVLAACAFGDPPPDDPGEPPNLPTPSAAPEEEGAVAEVIAQDLAVPWGIAFLPDGTALVTERDSAKILEIATDGTVSEVQTVAEVRPDGEGGLMGIVASPSFEDDDTVYIYYTAETDNRIARLKLGGTPEPIVTGIPKGVNHNGGQLAFGPDGFLYAGTGEAGNKPLAQDKSNLGGKILRFTTDGKPAEGNPFDDSIVYSYGHRNVQGLAWDAEERLYSIEFGQNQWDEVNLVEAGENYGWPEVEGIADNEDYADPLVVWSPDEASCSGAAISGEMLVTACLRGERLWMVGLDGEGGVDGEPQAALQGEFGRLRAVVQAPDGSLWVSTSNKDGRGDPQPGDDRILRIVTGGSGVGKA